MALISCVVLWIMYALCVHTSYYSSVGYCIVYISQGFTTTSILINGNQLHTFFFIYTAIGVEAEK